MAILNKSQIKEILEARFSADLHKKLCEIPLPCDLKDCYKAANRIKESIEKNELIAIVGDYDVDGIVSSVILSEFFDLLGVNYIIKIPNRFTDGYGLNSQIINELEGVKLIVTVDNGITANEAAKICKEKNIDLIITDHHIPSTILPEAYAIVNPKQKDCHFPNIEICGAQVAWYLVGALKETCNINIDMSSFLDILIIAIIADMMELRDLNRILLKVGIKKLNSSNRACFRAIKEFSGKREFAFDDIGFLIAPLLNSTGRMDDATISYEFLKSKNIIQANKILNMIEKLNISRKAEEKMLYEKSLQNIKYNDNIIIVYGDNWHEGVIGIVASRLAKHFKKPAIVFSIDKDYAKGSARSVGKFDILNLIAMQKDKLISYGGHRGAAGLIIKSELINDFKNAINQTNENFTKFNHLDEILGELDLCDIDMELVNLLEFFEPYGQKNPKPTFQIKNAKVLNLKFIGREKQHLKLILTNGKKKCEALYFNPIFIPKIGNQINIIFTLSKNIYKGISTPEILINDIL